MRLVDQVVDHVPATRGSMPSDVRSSRPACLSSRRRTTRSPWPEGMRRDAHVDRAAGDAQADAAVLRQAFFGDVELRHDLDARDQQRRDRALRPQHLAQHAVDAEAHDEPVLVRLDVDVGGVFLDRLRQHRIDQADDRGVVVALHEIGRLRQFLGRPGEVGLSLIPSTIWLASPIPLS